MAKKRKHNTTVICGYCGKKFTCYSCQSRPPRKFCSPTCRNKARILPDEKCPICGKMFHPKSWGAKGKKKTCSQSCGTKLQYLTKPHTFKTWTEEQESFVRQYYPTHGAEYCAEHLGYTPCAIQCKANKLGVRLTDRAYYKRVHQAARRYMTDNNPMFQQETIAKVQEFYASHPDQKQKLIYKSLQSKREYFIETATEPQRRLWQLMEDAGLIFEKEYVIKPGFCVDCAFPTQRVIAELFGCYWHGHHCRFPDPDERQTEQQSHDVERYTTLSQRGWTIIRVWECELEHDPQGCIKVIMSALP